MIPRIGDEGQMKLSRSSVLVAGAGGLGSPALTCLAAAGVGRIGIADSDTVEISNLNRQFLFCIDDIGRPKAGSARDRLLRMNNQIGIEAFNDHLTELNAEKIIAGYDFVIGAVDSFRTRFAINRACVSLNIPYADGGVRDFSGHALFSFPPQTPCLNCVFPAKSGKPEKHGVIGTVTGVVGTMLANIALAHLLGLPNHAANKLLLYDGLRMGIDQIEIKRNDKCPVCGRFR